MASIVLLFTPKTTSSCTDLNVEKIAIADCVEDTMKDYFDDLKLKTTFDLEESLVRIYTARGGSVINLRFYPNGILHINIDYVQAQYSVELYDKILSKIEKNLLSKEHGFKWIRSSPNLNPLRMDKYYLTSDNRLVEYDVDKVVFDERTKYQKVQIVHSPTLGNILVLDYMQNLAESDLIYTHTLMQKGQEIYTNKSVLILGGGDGALLYELLKENPKEVIMLELDEVVMKACAKYMRSVCGNVLDNYDGPNYKIIVGDCLDALEEYGKKGKKFDYVFGDLTDIPISVDQSKELWDFVNQVLRLSFNVLLPTGKYMTHVNGVGAAAAVGAYKEQLGKLNPPVSFTTNSAFVPSFFEEWVFCQVNLKRD